MKSLVFDTGPIISFALNNLLWTFPRLKDRYKGEFLITPAIKGELVDKPLQSKRFKFEAHQVARLLRDRVLTIFSHSELAIKAREISDIANNTFFAHNHPITIVHEGEMEAISCVLLSNADAIVIDERTTRYLIEEPAKIHMRLEKKLHTKIEMDKRKINQIKRLLPSIKVIRSIELVTVAFEMGMLDHFIREGIGAKKDLLDALLWGMKLNGCAVSEEEIKLIEKKVISK